MKTFPMGGVHPSDNKKWSNTKAIEVMDLPDIVNIPLGQHIGAPATAKVAKGDKVLTGQLIAEASSFMSANIHSPVSGTVTAVDMQVNGQGLRQMMITIKREGDEWMPTIDRTPQLVRECTLDGAAIIAKIKDAGVVGMGGATFPTHVKLSVPPGCKAEYLIINGVECEPYLTSDHRTMLERGEELLVGIEILKRAVGVDKAVIGIENNKPDAIALMEEKVAPYDNIRVCAARTQYPEGAEKMLIKKVMGRQVPSGKLPADVGCVVSNTSTAKAISDAIQKGLPLVERVVSVTGEFIRNPGNYIVKLGTNVQEIIDHCGGVTGDDVVLKMGGPMMGAPIKDTNVPIIKGSNGIIAIAADHTEEKECIKCGRCMDVCPMELAPLDIYKYAQLGDAETLLKLNVMDCFSCKCCEYICSSKIPLVSKINAAKGLVMPLLKKK